LDLYNISKYADNVASKIIRSAKYSTVDGNIVLYENILRREINAIKNNISKATKLNNCIKLWLMNIPCKNA